MNAVVQLDPIDAMGIIRWTEGMKIEPGFLYKDLPDGLYHRGPGISKSGLDLIHRSPAHFKFLKANPPPETRALHIGKAFHCLLLEPEKFKRDYIKSPYLEFRTREAKEWKERQEAAGKFVIRTNSGDNDIWNASEWDELNRMLESVMNHPIASTLFSEGVYEVSGYWVDKEKTYDVIETAKGPVNFSDVDPTFRLCKLRMDWYNYAHNIIVDLKTTEDASYSAFARSMIEYRYPVQDAFYRNGMLQLGKPVDEFVFVAVEKNPPYAVACYTLDAKAKQLGKNMYRRDLEKYHACRIGEEWPSYEPMRDMELPNYAYTSGKIY